MRKAPVSFQIPFREKLIDSMGMVSFGWAEFFRLVKSYLDPMGIEKSFSLVNGQLAPDDIEGLFLDRTKISHGNVEYLIQRITTSTGAVELVESGIFRLNYLPSSQDWELLDGPSTTGVTLTVTNDGQVQYETDLIAGTPYISRIIWRVRSIAAKHSSYSEAG